MRLFKIFLLLLIAVSFVAPDQSDAIPAFARRYKVSCTTCHAPFPKLKPYGDEFAGNGFIMVEEEKARDYVTAGDDLLWLNKDFPLAIRFDAYALYDEKADVDKDLETPWGLKFMSGGTLYKSIGYYFYFYMSERGEVAGIEDAYIHFDNVFDTQLDVMVGQFQTSDPLMKRELRLTFEDYVIYTKQFGSNTNLAYDRGIMLVYGLPQTGTDIIGFVVNGNGKAEADEDTKKFDSNKYKNFGIRVSQGIGDILSFGGYYYQGKEVSAGLENEITYYGPDINIGVGPLEFTGQYLVREDSNPMYEANAETQESSGIVAELIFAPNLDRSRFYLVGLYNQVDSDLEGYAYETATLSGSYLLSRNLRLILEYTRDLEFENNRVTLGLVSGF
ncbi:hypothetical protein GF337_08995 [candidate division KSB1 bacterium]|nr:hypothetical protein [candidate division KSB1 bacterium]